MSLQSQYKLDPKTSIHITTTMTVDDKRSTPHAEYTTRDAELK